MTSRAKQPLIYIITFCLILLFSVQAYADTITPVLNKDEIPPGPSVVAKSAILIDAHSGAVLFDKNMHQQLPPASTTKALTGIIALEKGKLTDKVRASKKAAETEASSIYLLEGEEVTVEDLVWALMLNSANDAAVALAEHLGGSVEGFSKIMNSTARAYGAKNSNFVNPNGLPDDNHYTSAFDLAMIAKHAMANDKFREIVGTRKKQIERQRPDGIKHLFNHNKLLSRYEGATGIKTGYTVKAQQCLIASAKRGNQEFIAVVLASSGGSMWSDATALLDYGFANFDATILAKDGEKVSPVNVKDGTKSLNVVVSRGLAISHLKGQNIVPQREVVIKEIQAPIQAGKIVGKVTFKVNSQSVGSVDLIAAEDVDKVKFASKTPIKIIGGLVVLVLVAVAGVKVWIAKKKQEARRRMRRERYSQLYGE